MILPALPPSLLPIPLQPSSFPSSSFPPTCARPAAAIRSLTPVTLALVVTYPETYPDVIPDMAVEEIDEELGELRDGEAEAIIEQLSVVVSPTPSFRPPSARGVDWIASPLWRGRIS